ncbi:class I SAM-dependent RNA methyltransferase [Crossiella cryophila]|uniref:tRNA/tmRNA/rRNA uracil-C5-methylase (TrmA/RlmC/RlmD family) n=1 Tax=Crossiella cryophila TaxID=43355 RepID=A0A7W7C9C9_9PSEU|nr:TRAM domain-containing protein [Crossiella cryophila]MBB4676977.1 tRNA/tmRNA/rRNA uracil-C5-methylase (TrmA/RlmC/RlmD family) [Crossiella cryophila]
MTQPDRLDWTGRSLEVEIGPVAHGGHCVARHEGRVLFVRHALPGEKALVQVTEDNGGSFCRADAITVHTPSPDRVSPPCPLAAPGECGGCDWQHASPAAQRALKATVVMEQLQRIAGLDREVTVEELPGGSLDWRSRVRLAVGQGGRAGLRAHRSHRVIPLRDCAIALPGALEPVLNRSWKPGTELEVAKDGTGQVHVAEIRKDRPPRIMIGEGLAHEHAAGRDWRLASGGFWQVHPAAADTFAQVVDDWAQAPVGGTAWDLYGGVGLFGSVLARQVGPTGSVLVIESSKRAVVDGTANLADLPQVRLRVGRVERVLGSAELRAERPDVVVLDPPRKGAGKDVVAAVAAAGPDRVVHIACDPAALARDVGLFATHGYRLAELRAFDAFPNTHHMECIALLTR